MGRTPLGASAMGSVAAASRVYGFVALRGAVTVGCPLLAALNQSLPSVLFAELFLPDSCVMRPMVGQIPRSTPITPHGPQISKDVPAHFSPGGEGSTQ